MARQRSLLVRALWFLAVGWWATPVLVNVAWLCNATVVGIPVGVTLTNLVPTVLSLKAPRSRDVDGGVRQRGFLLRAVYFLLVGWWLSLLWANLAALLAVTVIGLPVAIWMFGKLPYVTSLYRF